MSRRTTVLVTGTVLLLLFGVLGAVLPVPYVAQVPGPTYNTLGDINGTPIITVTGREPNDTSGNLNLTTVGIPQGSLNLVRAVQGWFDSEVTVVPREQVYPTEVVVQGLPEGSPSVGRLQDGDAIVSVDGTPTPTQASLLAALQAIPPASAVQVGYTRAGVAGTATVTTGAAQEGSGSALGVQVLETPYAPFDVSIQVDDVGGPSAGLMLTLGIIDMVGDTDLTQGAVIAGTGTIDATGAVGPIGGIPLKLIAARDIGAVLFLVPAANCAEALQNSQPGLPMAKVATLDDALTALGDLRAGRTPAGC